MALSKTDSKILIQQLGLEGIEINGDNYNFRCPICGDSKKNSSKKRGYLFWDTKHNRGYRYKCFNCGVSYTLEYYLKLYNPDLYKQYVFDGLKYKYTNKSKMNMVKDDLLEKVDNSLVKKLLNDKIKEKIIIPITKIKKYNIREYIYNRRIPKHKLKYIYYIDNFYETLYEPIKKLLNDKNIKDGSFDTDPRIFWFIKNRNNEIIGIQGRSILEDAKIRYLTIKITDDVMVGNLENIQLSERVYVTEGFIDSLFLPNAVSLNGSSFKSTLNKLKHIGVEDIVIIFDNEPYNKEIRKKVVEVVNESIMVNGVKLGVCLLPERIRNKGKDVNDYIKNGIDISKLINIINENTHYGKIAKIKMLRW